MVPAFIPLLIVSIRRRNWVSVIPIKADLELGVVFLSHVGEFPGEVFMGLQASRGASQTSA
jgi:hypothetical protein